MPSLLITVMVALALVFTAKAQSVQVPVTPNQLNYSNFVFAVATQATNGGVAFRVTITSQNAAISDDCAASLAIISGTGKSMNVAGVTPAMPVTLNKAGRIWQADFLAASENLSQPDILFIFVVPDSLTQPGGTRSYLPTDRIYEIRLADFLRQ